MVPFAYSQSVIGVYRLDRIVDLLRGTRVNISFTSDLGMQSLLCNYVESNH